MQTILVTNAYNPRAVRTRHAMNMLDLPSSARPAASAELLPVSYDSPGRSWRDDEPAAIALSELPIGEFATIHAVLPADTDADRQLVMRLIEIGFVPGERVSVVAKGRPGHEPVAVRLSAADSGRKGMNGSTFAMRRHEADFIRIVADVPAVRRMAARG